MTRVVIFLLFLALLFESQEARRLEPIGFFPNQDVKLGVSLPKTDSENDLKIGIIDKNVKENGFEVDEKVGETAHQIMDELKYLICRIAYPRPCRNIAIEITSSEEKETTTTPAKPTEKNKNNIYFRLRTMKKRWNKVQIFAA